MSLKYISKPTRKLNARQTKAVRRNFAIYLLRGFIKQVNGPYIRKQLDPATHSNLSWMLQAALETLTDKE